MGLRKVKNHDRMRRYELSQHEGKEVLRTRSLLQCSNWTRGIQGWAEPLTGSGEESLRTLFPPALRLGKRGKYKQAW